MFLSSSKYPWHPHSLWALGPEIFNPNTPVIITSMASAMVSLEFPVELGLAAVACPPSDNLGYSSVDRIRGMKGRDEERVNKLKGPRVKV